MNLVKKYRVDHQVVFEWKGVTRIGTVEAHDRLGKKALRYIVRDEAGQLYPAIGIDTRKGPGKILSKFTKAKFGKKNAEQEETKK